MRYSIAVVSIALAAGAVAFTGSSAADAAYPNATTGPSGPGTEVVDAQGRVVGMHAGWEAAGALGTGFAGTYELGLAGRVGYTFNFGMYVGGDAQGYWGNSFGSQTAHATFFGGELGYKLFVLRPVEVRPYVFAGPAFISQVGSSGDNSHTGFAVQPGVLLEGHFGRAFIGADAHFLTTPGPVSLALMGTAGAGF